MFCFCIPNSDGLDKPILPICFRYTFDSCRIYIDCNNVPCAQGSKLSNSEALCFLTYKYITGAYAAFSAGGCTLSLSGPHVSSP